MIAGGKVIAAFKVKALKVTKEQAEELIQSPVTIQPKEMYLIEKGMTKEVVDYCIARLSALKCKTLRTFESLVRLGDSPQLACITILSKRATPCSDSFYRFAYHS